MTQSDNSYSVPSRTKLMFTIILIAIIVSGIAEIFELTNSIYISKWDFVFQILEHVIMVILLFIFLKIFVTKPLTIETIKRKDAESELLKTELSNRIIMEAMPDDIIHVSADGTILDVKVHHEILLNFIIGKNIADNFDPDYKDLFLWKISNTLITGKLQVLELVTHTGKKEYNYEFRFVKANKHELLVYIRIYSSNRIDENKITYLSNHDSMTSLYNRNFYEAELEVLKKSVRYPIGIININIDELKNINNTMGYAVGDRIVLDMAKVLQNNIGTEDLAARVGGDEFAIILPETNVDSLNELKFQIRNEIEKLNSINSDVAISFSIGTAIAETNETLIESVKLANKRMYIDRASKFQIEMAQQ